MLKKENFNNLVFDLLFTQRQLIYNGYLHNEIKTEVYNKYRLVWNALILSLEFGSSLGLARILEDQYFGRKFGEEKLDKTCEKLVELRNNFHAHRNHSKLRNEPSFFIQNQLNGTELLNLVDALKNRAITYDNQFKVNMHVEELFKNEIQSSVSELKDWLKIFRK